MVSRYTKPCLTAVTTLALLSGAVAPIWANESVHAAVPNAVVPVPSYSQWQRDVTAVMKPAIPWLTERKSKGGENLAVVLDIDNTALETHYNAGNPNKPVLKFAQWASENDIKVLFVTARTGSDNTKEELRSAGYAIDGMCGRNEGSKEECRAQLSQQGYTITANVGNRDQDFTGGYYEKAYQLPDYDGELS